MLVVVLATGLSAKNGTAIDYYESGDLNKAKSIFLADKNLDAMDYYYLGQIYLKEKNEKKASEAFTKGTNLDTENLYNQVGLARIQLVNDPKGAEKVLKGISGNKLYKKDVQMQVAIAEAFARNGSNDIAQTYLSKAKKADKKSALPYILEGNLFMEKNNQNEAAVRFENAVYFDPNSKIALVKLAQLYVGTRRQIAFDYLDRATTIDPNYEYGWKTQADLRREAGFYPEARAAFENYLKLVNPTPEDNQIYGQILYFSKDYNAAMEALAKAPVNTVTNRLKMYIMHDQERFEDAVTYAQALTTNSKNGELIRQDYIYYANALNKTKDFEKAGNYFELAFEKDTTKFSTLTDAARAYDKAKDYPKAIETYEKVLVVNPEHSMADIYSLGVACYGAGTDVATIPDSLQRASYLVKAGEVFGKMAELFPEHYLGYLYQARSNSALDPNTTLGLAKPYYEKVLEICLLNSEERRNEILEVYQYMGIYYLKTDKYPQSREFWVKVLEIDPNNATAKQVIASIDSVKKR